MLRILAALIFFTRLPFWKLAEVPATYFKNIVSMWPLAGWLTSGISVFVLLLASQFFPAEVSVLFAIISRLLVTGCLHEDGLADFFDGFGGGTSRERILSIMKDSHIGSYGVIGLIMYFLLLYLTLSSMPLQLAAAAILTGDPLCKGISGMIINRLPYARNDNKRIYNMHRHSSHSIAVASGCSLFVCNNYPGYRMVFSHIIYEKENRRIYRRLLRSHIPADRA